MPCLLLAPNQISNDRLHQFFIIILIILIETIYIFHYKFPGIGPRTSLFIWTLPGGHVVISLEICKLFIILDRSFPKIQKHQLISSSGYFPRTMNFCCLSSQF